VQEETGATEIAPTAGGRADTDPSFRSGETLAGRFVLHDRLGRGGSGTVFSALDTMVGDRIAVKILDRAARDPANRERLRRETRATRSGHPNVVSIHELYEHDGLLFITMELVEGSSLRTVLEERERLTLDDVVLIGRQIASALDHLHVQGLVHRDVKPGNIMLAPAGAAKLCDMGLARPMATGATVTETEMVVGTPAYMAPEMAREGELVAASDVYALGLTLYQCLTGEVPLARTTAVDTLMARQRTRARPVRALRPECPRWLGRLLDRMLDPDPDLRPTAAEVALSLEKRRFGWRPHRRHLIRAAAVLVIALVAAAAVEFGLRVKDSPTDPADDPVANELLMTQENFENGAIFKIVDGHDRAVLDLRSPVRWNEKGAGFFRNNHVAFSDLDGDGRRDMVFGIGDATVERQLEFYHRQADGGLTLTETWDLHLEVRYDDEVFDAFLPCDVVCSDLSGDGRPEIIIGQRSTPYYPGAVRVFEPSGREILRILHPGQIANVVVGDRDRDGRGELYIGATNNFVAENMGRESSPVAFVVATDWDQPGQVLDLFASGRRLAAAAPPGMDVVYISFKQQHLVEAVTPWRYAVVGRIKTAAESQYLEINSDRLSWKNDTAFINLRTFFFDSGLRLTGGTWNSVILNRLEANEDDPDLRSQLAVTYWNGTDWQSDVCTIPQAD